MPRTHATATLVHQNYFGLVIGDATTTATTTRGHDHRRNDAPPRRRLNWAEHILAMAKLQIASTAH